MNTTNNILYSKLVYSIPLHPPLLNVEDQGLDAACDDLGSSAAIVQHSKNLSLYIYIYIHTHINIKVYYIYIGSMPPAMTSAPAQR